MEIIKSEMTELLDHVESELLVKEKIGEALDLLGKRLNEMRGKASFDSWKQMISNCYPQHSISRILFQDPLTRRAFQKPRGYAGDAIMMDLVYATESQLGLSTDESLTEFGRNLHSHVLQFSACKAVRSRKQLIAKTIDEVASKINKPRILSVACGHLREAENSKTVLEGRIGRFIALDQDIESLQCVKSKFTSYGVEPIHASVKDILLGKFDFSDFDLIYSAGLYDYLKDPVAISLTRILFEKLSPGGRMLIANFLPNHQTVGYMEACMDWWLIYRDKVQMKELLSSIHEERVKNTIVYEDVDQSVVYLDVLKA